MAPGVPNGSTPDLTRLADLHERIRLGEQRLTAIKDEIGQLSAEQLDEAEVDAGAVGLRPAVGVR